MATTTSMRWVWVLGGVVLVAALGGVFYWLSLPQRGLVADLPVPATLPASQVAVAPAEAASAAVPTTVDLPADTTPVAAPGIAESLQQLLGRQAMLSFVQTDDFPRRLVATVDNLGRESVPSRLWPVNPTRDRFSVVQREAETTISPDNSARYTPFVLLVEAVDMRRLAELYARMYPVLQEAYEGLGYPNRSFNDRLLEVIDLLLRTPEPAGPVKLELLQIKGPVPSQRPWVRYQYADPALESLAAGQKVLIRMGLVNEQRIKARLVELRQHIAARSRALAPK